MLVNIASLMDGNCSFAWLHAEQVIGPRPLRRALQAYAALEPMRFRYIDTVHTVVRAVLSSISNDVSTQEIQRL